MKIDWEQLAKDMYGKHCPNCGAFAKKWWFTLGINADLRGDYEGHICGKCGFLWGWGPQ